MNVNQDELAKLTAMLNSYKQKHGQIVMDNAPTMNCAGCSSRCGGSCTNSCTTYCDGSSGFCWRYKG